MADCQAKVSYSTHAVLLDQDIFRLEVTVSNARLTCRRTDDTSLHLHQELSRDSTCSLNVNDCCVCFHLFIHCIHGVLLFGVTGCLTLSAEDLHV